MEIYEGAFVDVTSFQPTNTGADSEVELPLDEFEKKFITTLSQPVRGNSVDQLPLSGLNGLPN